MLYKVKNDVNKVKTRTDASLGRLKNVEEKRKEIIEKFSVKFDKFYHKMYDFGKFVRMLNMIFEKEETVRNFDFAQDFLLYEQKILEKLQIQSVPTSSNSLPKNTQNQMNIIEIKNNQNSINTTTNAKVASFNDILVSKSLSKKILITKLADFIPVKRKVDVIKSKKSDAWSLIAKHNYNEFNEELKLKRKNLEENRKSGREILAHQILLKNERKDRDKDNDEYYIKVQIEKNNNYDRNLIEKKEHIKREIMKEKEIRDNILKCKNIFNFLLKIKVRNCRRKSTKKEF